MSTSEKCLKCNGTPLTTGKCDPRTCTVVFPLKTNLASMGDFWCLICGTSFGHMTDPPKKCPNCGAKLSTTDK